MLRVSADGTSTAKSGLRREVRDRRRRRAATQSASDRRSAAVRLADAVLGGLRALSGEDAGRGALIAVYESLPTEPPTEALIEWLLAVGYEVVVPVTLPDRDLDWRPSGAPVTAVRGPGSIQQARVVVVPALAVDRSGRRLGQGGDRSNPVLGYEPAGLAPLLTTCPSTSRKRPRAF